MIQISLLDYNLLQIFLYCPMTHCWTEMSIYFPWLSLSAKNLNEQIWEIPKAKTIRSYRPSRSPPPKINQNKNQLCIVPSYRWIEIFSIRPILSHTWPFSQSLFSSVRVTLRTVAEVSPMWSQSSQAFKTSPAQLHIF